MASMSTPIQQLPAGAPPTQPEGKLEEDPAVAELIHEMTQQRSPPAGHAVPTSPAAPRVPLVSGSPPPMAYPLPTVFGSTTPVVPVAAPRSWLSNMWDADLAQHAVMVAVLAFALFYPADLSEWYARVPFLARLAPYDRVLRMVLLALAVYVVGHVLDI